jgi:hypothetical protein
LKQEEERKLKAEKEKEDHEKLMKEELERMQKLQREENEKRQLAESLQRRQELELEAAKRKQELEAQRKQKEELEAIDNAKKEREAELLEQKHKEYQRQLQLAQNHVTVEPTAKGQEATPPVSHEAIREVNGGEKQPKPVEQPNVTEPTEKRTEKVSNVNIELPEHLQGKDKDEIIKILLDKMKLEDTNHELFLRLQEELKQKEKQYEILRGKQKMDQEGKKLAEEKLELLKQEIKNKDEEMAAKDKHIRQLTKKLKQARKDWITNDYNPNDSNSVSQTGTSPHSVSSPIGSAKSWQLNPEIDLKNREIKQLKEAIWAHQNQNASLSAEVL